MAYADSAYYTGTFGGDVIPDDQITKYLQRASDDVDILTYSRIAANGWASLTASQQAQVQKAVCYQAEHLYQYGDMATFGVNNYHVGDVTVGMAGIDLRFAAQAKEALKPTGLTYRGFTANETALF